MRQEEPMDLWVYEREAFDAGIKLVCGVDEAGACPLMGPVYARRRSYCRRGWKSLASTTRKSSRTKSAGSCTIS